MSGAVTAKRRSVLEPVRAGVRRFQLIMGLGLLSVIVSSVIVVPLSLRLRELGSAELPVWLAWTLATLVSQLWAWAILPGLLYAVARIIDLRPWSAAVGSVATAMGFVLLLKIFTSGLDGLGDEHPARLVTLALTAAAGVLLGRLAVLSGRRAAKQKEEEAARAAEARKGEYEQFAKEAERLAAQHGGQATSATSEPPPATPSNDEAPSEQNAPAATDAPSPGAPREG